VIANPVAGNGADGVRISPVAPTSILNVGSNTVSGNGGAGIAVDATDAPVRGLSVVGNQIAADGRQQRGVVLNSAVDEALVATNGVTGDHDEPLRDHTDGADVLVELNLA